MAALTPVFNNFLQNTLSNSNLAISIDCRILVYSYSDSTLTEVDIPVYVPESDPDVSKTSKVVSSEEGSDRILSTAASPDGKYLAACDDRKRLFLWNITAPTIQLVSNRNVVRRCTALVFTHCGQNLLVCDKSGDVYKFSLMEPQTDGLLLKGHLSMLLDMFISVDDRFIVTCDRDEKIHVSHYPNAYNIQTYCLGHSEFVSSLVDLRHKELFLSASGDGTIRLWNYLTGDLLQSIDCSSHPGITSPETDQSENVDTNTSEDVSLSDPLVVKSLAYHEATCTLAVCFHKRKFIHVYHLTTDNNLHPRTTLSSDGHLLDVCFDCGGAIHAVKSSENDLFVVFAPNKDGDYKKLSNAESTIMETINSRKDLLKGLDDQKSLLPALYKSKVDNLHFYRAKKEERLKSKSTENAAKKLKT